jgi:AraC-like DNA-binding protein
MGYLNTWQHGALATTPQMQLTFADHIYDLVALLFNARSDAAEQARQHGGREALRAMITGEIERHCLDPDFSLPALAKCVGVGPRYVQMLLAEVDSSFVKQVTQRRVQRAHVLLLSPHHQHLSILDIAYECGFNTKTNFNQMFRRFYGATPREVRNEKEASLINSPPVEGWTP